MNRVFGNHPNLRSGPIRVSEWEGFKRGLASGPNTGVAISSGEITFSGVVAVILLEGLSPPGVGASIFPGGLTVLEVRI